LTNAVSVISSGGSAVTAWHSLPGQEGHTQRPVHHIRTEATRS